jgi:hypothetical protein
MERRFRTRLDEVRRDAHIPPGLLRGLGPRLDQFLRPFVAAFTRAEQRDNAGRYVRGLLSTLGAKTAEAIAYLHDRDRQGLQKFVGQSPWDHRPLRAELARQVGAELGEADAVLAFDPSAFAKKGDRSVGVQRQWCGRLGKLENCQVGVYLAYVSRREHALVDTRLYLPREWTRQRKRMLQAGVPSGTKFRTRHELALEMLDEHGVALPHGWVSGDDELGRSSWFRRELRGRNERYLLAVPSNTSVRDLAAGVAYAGRGRRPKAPFTRADRWAAGLPAGAWAAVEVRAAERGPLAVQAARTPVQARADQPGVGGGRGAGGVPGAAAGWVVEARLPAVERPGRHPAGGVRPGVQGPPPGRGVPPAGQGGGRAGRLPGADVGGVAPPPGAIVGRRVVPHRGGPAGEKSGPRP